MGTCATSGLDLNGGMTSGQADGSRHRRSLLLDFDVDEEERSGNQGNPHAPGLSCQVYCSICRGGGDSTVTGCRGCSV